MSDSDHVTRDQGTSDDTSEGVAGTSSEIKALEGDEKKQKQADKIKISSRKRVNSETVPGLVSWSSSQQS
jgi:hypothetical protein